MDCLFCKIVGGSIPSTKVYENETVYAFRDIHPMAPVHVLVIPKEHLPDMDAVNAANSRAVADVFDALVSQRSYKKPFSFEKAVEIIREESGTHFDPTVAEAFLKIANEAYEKQNGNKQKK